MQAAGSPQDAPMRSRTPVNLIHRQEDDSSIDDMQNAMERLLAVFSGTESNVRTATNLWHVCTFKALAAHASVSLNYVEDICTDTLFCNKPAHIAYETLIRFIPVEAQTTSIIWVPRVDAYMARRYFGKSIGSPSM